MGRRRTSCVGDIGKIGETEGDSEKFVDRALAIQGKAGNRGFVGNIGNLGFKGNKSTCLL
ncbi:hypothetical protein GCM10009000_081810 [Halobacterium noricense]|uniref:Uncharacterized protein n=1 Tax=Haladaptatus pallidirubidus TaxID=1008152 RepID=A0AAV3UQ81_9EURY